jgi:hypothetical protein
MVRPSRGDPVSGVDYLVSSLSLPQPETTWETDHPLYEARATCGPLGPQKSIEWGIEIHPGESA